MATSQLPSSRSPTLSAGTAITSGYVVHMREHWLHHRCRLGGPQRSARGQQSEMAMWSTCGSLGGPQRSARGQQSQMGIWSTCRKSGCITLVPLAFPNAQRVDNHHKWLCGPHAGKVATSALPSWEFPTLNAWKNIRNGYVVHMWAKRPHHPAVLGVPNAQRVDNNHKWLCGSHASKVATSTLPFWGSPTLNAGIKIRNGYVVHMWVKWPQHPCRLGGSPTLSAGIKIRNGYVVHMWAKWLYNSCRVGGPQRSVRG